MKTKIRLFGCLLVAAACLWSVGALAGVYSYTYTQGQDGVSFLNNGVVPDGNATGWSDTRSLSGLAASISSVAVTLNVSSGNNGDLYAYLSHNGVLVPLLNRVGVTAGNPVGYSQSGFLVTLSDAGSFDIHSYNGHSPALNGNGQLTGTWQADGRTILPNSAPASFDSASRVNFAGSYGNMNPNGAWTLFVADMSGGDATQCQVVSWGLDITAVPEPVTMALGIFAGVFLVVVVVQSRLVRNRVQRWQVAVVQWIDAV